MTRSTVPPPSFEAQGQDGRRAERRGGQVGGSGESSPSHEPRSTVATAAVAAGEAQRVCVRCTS